MKYIIYLGFVRKLILIMEIFARLILLYLNINISWTCKFVAIINMDCVNQLLQWVV